MKINLVRNLNNIAFRNDKIVHKRRRQAQEPLKQSAADKVFEFSSWAKSSINNAFVSVDALIREKKAASIQKRIEQDANVSQVIDRYKETTGDFDEFAQKVIKSFKNQANKYERNYLHLKSVNPFYLSENCPEFISAQSLFGDDSYVYYSREKEYAPYSKKFRWVNMPCALTIGESRVKDDHKTISTVYDFDKSTICWGFYSNPQFSASAVQMLVLDSKDSYGYLGNISQFFGQKMFLENVTISQTEGVRADLMTIFDTDDNGEIVSLRTYLYPRIQPFNKDDANIYTADKFVLKADDCIVSNFTKNNLPNSTYYRNIKEIRDIDGAKIKADAMVEKLDTNYLKVSINYNNDGFLPKCEYKQIRHI